MTIKLPEQEIPHEAEMSPELQILMQLVKPAGEVLKKYHPGNGDDESRLANLNVEYKTDQFDPVSIADREAEEVIRAALAEQLPDVKILGEENPLPPSDWAGQVITVDPLDNTKDYLAGGDSSAVMMALVENGIPKMGVVYNPFKNEYYFAEAGKGAYRTRNGQPERLHIRPTNSVSESVLVGRIVRTGDIRPIDDAIAQMGFKSTVTEGSIGVKIGLIAAGEADAFIHTNLKAGKWDTAPAEIILREAGGVMSDIDGQPLDYTKLTNGWDRYFMAAATPELLTEMTTKLGDIYAATHSF